MKMIRFVLASVTAVLMFASVSQASVSVRALQPSATENSNDQYVSEFFGNVRLNFSQYAAWEITNNGDQAITFAAMNLRGMMFYGNTNCPDTLEPSQKCTVQVRFTPTMVGSHTGALDVLISDGHNIFFDFWGYGIQ